MLGFNHSERKNIFLSLWVLIEINDKLIVIFVKLILNLQLKLILYYN